MEGGSYACRCLVFPGLWFVLYLQFQSWELSCLLQAPALCVQPFSPVLPGRVGGEDWVTLPLERLREQGRASPPLSQEVLLGIEMAGFCYWGLPTWSRLS